MLDFSLSCVHEVVLLEQNIVNQQTIGPHVDLRAIRFLSEQFWGHEDRSAHDILVDLFLDCKTEVSQFVDHVARFTLVEDIVRFDVTMDYFSS